MAPEAPLEHTDHGLAPAAREGWFVLNAREARWRRRPGRGHSLPLTGWSDEECETYFKQLGVAVFVLGPGEPIGMYHWEADTEGFLVLSGEALLIVESEERPLHAWDYFHCPPRVEHMILGAGDGPCVVLAVGSRQFAATPQWGGYTADETARRHGVSVEEDTPEPDVAYAPFEPPEPARYDGWLDG